MRIETLIAIVGTMVMQLAGCAPPAGDERGLPVDVLLTGGLIYDGSGNLPVSADLGINAGKIVFIGDAKEAGVSSRDTFDATGSTHHSPANVRRISEKNATLRL